MPLAICVLCILDFVFVFHRHLIVPLVSTISTYTHTCDHVKRRQALRTGECDKKHMSTLTVLLRQCNYIRMHAKQKTSLSKRLMSLFFKVEQDSNVCFHDMMRNLTAIRVLNFILTLN